jgi:hypothetical protein
VRALAERTYFLLCRALGRVLRSATYATTRVVRGNGAPEVRKRRSLHAPLLVSLAGLLVRILDTGVRVLPQREWEERERLLYRHLHGAAIRVDAGRTLVLPCLPGETLATLLDDPRPGAPVKRRAIERAVVALVELHRQGWTHGDAMAENVMVDLEAGVARWFDFETVHDEARPMAWRRADDLRALLATCLLRTAAAGLAATAHLVVRAYADEEVIRLVAVSFADVLRRPLPFHLGQAGLSHARFREIGRLLRVQVRA